MAHFTTMNNGNNINVKHLAIEALKMQKVTQLSLVSKNRPYTVQYNPQSVPLINQKYKNTPQLALKCVPPPS